MAIAVFLAVTAFAVPAARAADFDADGVDDATDDCPSTFNPLQADCDGDGVGNACDASGTDADQDGVCDAADNCAALANADQSDCNGNGVGNLCEASATNRDDDRDGVCNGADSCPREAGSCAMQAITVPWVPANPSIPHPTYSGATHTLKGIARYGGNQFMWDFGDGTAMGWSAITSAYNLGVNHVYTGSVGQIFIATLSVRNASTPTVVATASYRVKIESSGPLPTTSPYAMDPNQMDVRISMAIDQGLWWLHTSMSRATYPDSTPGYAQPYGYWGGSYPVASTCAAVDALFLHGSKPNKDYATDPYVETAQRALDYILASYTGYDTITPQVHAGVTDRPDYNLNGIGVYFGTPSTQMYERGICGVAIASSGTPTRQSLVGGSAFVRGRTYKDIVQDVAEWFAWAQADGGNFRGGWHYTANTNTADGSTNQWPMLAIAAGEDNMAITTPRFVRSEAPYFMAYTHNNELNSRNGGWGYQASNSYVNHVKTAAGMLFHYFEGDSPSHPEVQAALGFLYRNWSAQNYDGGGAWNVGLGNSYAMYGIMKAMRKPQPNILRVAEYDYNRHEQTGNSFDWYYTPPGQTQVGLATDLVRRQAANGSWTDAIGNNAMSGALSTGWDVLILSKGVTTIPPEPAICNCDFTWDRNQGLTMDGSCSTHPDLNRHIVSYEWDFDYHTSSFDADATGVLGSLPAGYPAYGTYPIALRVTDDNPVALGGPQSAIASCSVTIKPANNCPHPFAGGPYLGTHDTPFQLDASASMDPDGDPLEFAWDLDNDGVFDDAAGATPWVSYGALGTFGVAVQVTDLRAPDAVEGPCSKVAYATAEIGNHAPVAVPGGPYAARPGQTITLDGSASSDPDGDSITFGWDLDNDGTFADSASVGPSFTVPATAPVGTVYNTCLKVTDALGRASDTACTTIVVQHLNTPPSCTLPQPAVVAECTGGAVAVTVDGSLSQDADGDPLTYAWSTDCPGGGFADPGSAITELVYDSDLGACSTGCVATLTVSDGEAQSTCTRQVETIDRTDPLFRAAPSDLSVECDGGTAAAVDAWLASAAATDACTSADLATDFVEVAGGCGGATGSATVTWTATDSCGNVAQASAVLSIRDTVAPVVECPAPATAECTGPMTPVDLTGWARAGDACFGALPAVGPDTASYPVGTTPVTFTATDACGNSGACTSSVIVRDTTPPALVCPADTTVECSAPGVALAVDAGVATGDDLCGAVDVVSDTPADGTYPLGRTTTTHTATDAAGNQATCTSGVSVVDTVAPTLACPADLTVECNAPGAAAGVDVGVATGDDVCGGVAIASDAPAGGLYPLGATTTTFVGSDGSGNQASCTTVVDVVDTTAPELACPADVTIECNAPGSAVGVSAGAATAFELCTAASISDPPIAAYPLGTTVVTHGAVDANGNAASCTNHVTVVDTTAPVFDPASLGPWTVAGNCTGAPVTFPLPTATDLCEAATVRCEPLAGTSLGANQVRCTATDAAGNTSTADVTVNVLAPLRLAFQAPLSDDNAADDVATDADVANLFKVGSTVPNKLQIYACNGADVTTAVAAQVTLRLTVTYRQAVSGGDQVSIIPEYNGVGDAGGLLVLTGAQFHYNLKTTLSSYPAGTVNTAGYFSDLVTLTYNSAPEVVIAREDARLESR